MGEQDLRAIRERIRQLQYDNLVKAQELYQHPGVRGEVFLDSADPQEAEKHNSLEPEPWLAMSFLDDYEKAREKYTRVVRAFGTDYAIPERTKLRKLGRWLRKEDEVEEFIASVEGRQVDNEENGSRHIDEDDISEDEYVESERRVLAFFKQKQSELAPMDQRTLDKIYDRIAKKAVEKFDRVRKDLKEECR